MARPGAQVLNQLEIKSQYKYIADLIVEFGGCDERRRADIIAIITRYKIDITRASLVVASVKMINAHPEQFIPFKQALNLTADQIRNLLAMAARSSGAAFATIRREGGLNETEPADLTMNLSHPDTVAVCIAAGVKLEFIAAGAKLEFQERWDIEAKLAYFVALLAHGEVADFLTLWSAHARQMDIEDVSLVKYSLQYVSQDTIQRATEQLDTSFDVETTLSQTDFAYRALSDEYWHDGGQPHQPEDMDISARAEQNIRAILRQKFATFVQRSRELDPSVAVVSTATITSPFTELCTESGLDPYMFNAYAHNILEHTKPEHQRLIESLLKQMDRRALQDTIQAEPDRDTFSNHVAYYIASVLRKFNIMQLAVYEANKDSFAQKEPEYAQSLDKFIWILRTAGTVERGRMQRTEQRVDEHIQRLIASDTFEHDGTTVLGQLIDLAEAIARGSATLADVQRLFRAASGKYSLRYFPALETCFTPVDLFKILEANNIPAAELRAKRASFLANIDTLMSMQPSAAAASSSTTPAYDRNLKRARNPEAAASQEPAADPKRHETDASSATVVFRPL